MIANLISVRNWSRLSRVYGQDEETLYRNKRNILFSQITFLGVFIGLFHAGEDLLGGVVILSVMDVLMTAFVFLAYVINETGRHRAAKIFLLTFLNIFFFVYSLITPKELGIYLFFFPWVATAALVFEADEHAYRWLFILLPLVLLSILFVTNFNLLADFRFDTLVVGHGFIVNLLTSLIVTVSFIFLVVNMHESAEKRYKKLASEIQQKNMELQKTNEELDRFIYSASHDLKAPVNSIKGLTHLAQRDCDDPKSLSYFSRIENQTDRMGIFLLELFEYARNQRTNLRPEKVSISGLVDEIVDNLRYMDGADRIEFKKHIRVDGPVVIDRVRLMVILNNLISNAIKYHNYNQEKPWVKVMINRVGNTIQVMVADNGLGINNEFKDRIFEMFFRASDRPIGSGLGLFIVKETVEKMEGKIMVSSNPGEGACFRIDLPLVA